MLLREVLSGAIVLPAMDVLADPVCIFSFIDSCNFFNNVVRHFFLPFEAFNGVRKLLMLKGKASEA